VADREDVQPSLTHKQNYLVLGVPEGLHGVKNLENKLAQEKAVLVVGSNSF
jgi:hypothetical protein